MSSMRRALFKCHWIGFRLGMTVGVGLGMVAVAVMATVHVYAAEAREDRINRAEVEAAACHTELQDKRPQEALYRACVGGMYATQNEIANLVRSCR